MDALTASGAGLLIPEVDPLRSGLAAELKGLLAERRFLVIRAGLPDLPGTVTLLSGLGPINEAATRKDGAVMVEEHDDDEVFRSNAALPLHTDGVLTGFDVRYVGIWCASFDDVTGGRTFVSDADRALLGAPTEHVELLREKGIEVLALDATGYYRSEYSGTWTRFPAFRSRNAGPASLAIGLPHGPDEPESWRIRIPDVDSELSDAILASVREALLDEAHTYVHDWHPGDLLLMDNDTVMHGREAFSARSRRLANIQVLAT